MSSSPLDNSKINNENDNFQNINRPLRDNEEEINDNDYNNDNDNHIDNENHNNNDNHNDNENHNDNDDHNDDNNYNIEKEYADIIDNSQDNFSNTNKDSQPIYPPKNLNDDYPYYFKYSNSTKGDVFHKTRKFFPSYNKEYQINQLNEIFNNKNKENNPNLNMIEDINNNNSLNYKTPLIKENNYYNYMNNKTSIDLEYNYLKNLHNKETANKENIYYNNNNNLNNTNIISPIKIENGCLNKNINKIAIISKENSYKNLSVEKKDNRDNKDLNYNYFCDKFDFSDTLNNRKNKSNYEDINNNFITADKINIDFHSEERLPKDIIKNNKEYLINHEIKNIAFMFKKINFQNASPEPCLIKNKYAELF